MSDDRMISPIITATEVVLNGLAAHAGVDRSVMRNPDAERPWLIDEVRFTDKTPTTQDTNGNYTDAYGAFVGCRIKVVGHDVTQQYVPLWSLAPYENPLYLRNVSTYGYRPPKPIYVPAGETLAVDLLADPIATALLGETLSKTIEVAFVGRPFQGDVLPDEIDIPWVANWRPQFTNAGGNQQSTQDDMVNPFDRDLYVDWLVGNVLVGGNDTVGADAALAQQDVTEILLTMQMNHTTGGVMIRDPVPFGHVFSAIDRKWKARCVLPPSAYLLASLDMAPWTVAAEQPNAAYVNMALHGFRTMSREEYHG